jgi:hemerythrin
MDAVFLEWTSALAVGIEEIDSQHRELFLRVARVRDAAFAGDASEIERTLAFLHRYVAFHHDAELFQRRSESTDHRGKRHVLSRV